MLLRADVVALADEMAARDGSSRTAVVEMAIARLAEEPRQRQP